MIEVKGYEFNVPAITNTHTRRAQKFMNNIISSLRQLGLDEDDVEIDLEPAAFKRLPASASWYIDGYHCNFTYKAKNFAENMYVISKVVEFEVRAVLEDKKTVDEFINDFTEEKDVEDERKAARELIGVDPDCVDLAEINKKYKAQAKGLHPDMDGGDIDKFKALNRAHKILKRELE